MINAAIVGLGRWGQAHLNAVQGKSRRIRFVHGVSKEPGEAREIATKHGIRLSTDLADVLADPEVDAVFLATPHSVHVEQVIAVARAGKPVWCEKPLALTVKEARRALDAVRSAGVPLASGNNKRCFASMRALRQVVERGEIGEILHIEGHYSNEHSTRTAPGGWRDDPGQSPAAGLTGAGIHIVDAFVSLAGALARIDARVFSRRAHPDPRDSLAVLAQFTSGATGLMGTVRASPLLWRVHVFGTKGAAEARGEDELIVTKIGGKPQSQTFASVDSLRELAESFADAVEGKAPFLVSPEEMLATVAGIEGIVNSVALGNPVVIAN